LPPPIRIPLSFFAGEFGPGFFFSPQFCAAFFFHLRGVSRKVGLSGRPASFHEQTPSSPFFEKGEIFPPFAQGPVFSPSPLRNKFFHLFLDGRCSFLLLAGILPFFSSFFFLVSRALPPPPFPRSRSFFFLAASSYGFPPPHRAITGL